MAVQQNKKSPSKRGMHRSHNALVVPGIAVESTTGETHLRHHISPTVSTVAARCSRPSPKPENGFTRKARRYRTCSSGLLLFLALRRCLITFSFWVPVP